MMNSKLFPESYESHGISRRKIDFESLTPITQGRNAYKQNGLQSTDKMDQNGLYTESSHPSDSPFPPIPHSYVVLQVIFIVRDKEQLPATLLGPCQPCPTNKQRQHGTLTDLQVQILGLHTSLALVPKDFFQVAE